MTRCSVHDLLKTIQIEIWQSSENAVAVSMLDNTALLISILEASVVSERLMALACHSALKHACVSLAMCDRSD